LKIFICFFRHFWTLLSWIYSFPMILFWDYVKSLSILNTFSGLNALLDVFSLPKQEVFIKTVANTLFLFAKTLFWLFGFDIFKIYQIIIMSWKWFLFNTLIGVELRISSWIFSWFCKTIFSKWKFCLDTYTCFWESYRILLI